MRPHQRDQIPPAPPPRTTQLPRPTSHRLATELTQRAPPRPLATRQKSPTRTTNQGPNTAHPRAHGSPDIRHRTHPRRRPLDQKRLGRTLTTRRTHTHISAVNPQLARRATLGGLGRRFGCVNVLQEACARPRPKSVPRRQAPSSKWRRITSQVFVTRAAIP